MKCVILSCENDSSLRPLGVSFHRFPLNEQMKEVWLQSIGHMMRPITKTSKICSANFIQEHIFVCKNRIKLHPAAIPISGKVNKPENASNQMEPSSDDASSTDVTPGDYQGQEHSRPQIHIISNELLSVANVGCDGSFNIGALPEQIDVNNDVQGPSPKKMKCAVNDDSAKLFFTSMENMDSSRELHIISECRPATIQKHQESTPQNVEWSSDEATKECRRLECKNNRIKIRSLQKQLANIKQKLTARNKRADNLRQRLCRDRKKATNVKQLLANLKAKNLSSEDVEQIVENISAPYNKSLEHHLFQRKSIKTPKQFDLTIRAFALNLHFFSPRAYEYVRNTFGNTLPHQRTLRRWYQGVGCVPGFTQEAFEAIKNVVQSASHENIIVNIVFDEMNIRQHVEWDGHKAFGYVDLGDGGNIEKIATQMLVFMAVFINKSWKIPIAFFPIATITAEQKQNLVSMCIDHLLETGVEVIGITFDGLASNLYMTKLLGSDVRCIKSEGFITHNDSPEKYILHPDSCHMFKLCRNALADLKAMLDGDGNIIKWDYINSLQELQECEGLHLGNKLRKAHIYFSKQKMKVRLAVQTFSDSVADALDFCRESLQLKQFAGSRPTANFIRIFNEIFDILNSRKLSSFPASKQALCERNFQTLNTSIAHHIQYIKGLRLLSGVPIIESKRYVGFVGLITGMQNMKVLYERFIDSGKLKFIPMYKLSQDHVELFFGSIRGGLGNNNPTMRQFISRYKKLLFRTQIKDGGMGNCMPLEHIPLLNAKKVSPLEAINISVERSAMIEESTFDEEAANDNFLLDHSYAADPTYISSYAEHVVEYIAGFVVFKLCNVLKCFECMRAIQGQTNPKSLMSYKNRGGLHTPSESTIMICKLAEKEIKREQRINKGGILHKTSFDSITNFVQSLCIGRNLFPDHSKHMQETMHYSSLIKLIIEKYLNTRYYFMAKNLSQKVSLRQQFTKILHFKGM